MLSLSSEAYFLSEADSHIQANLEDSVVQQALKSGVDLREYSKQVEDELREVEEGSIQDYIQQAESIAGLHQQIVECDSLLGSMERMLLNFQSDLGSISSEILSLQQQSVHMNIKLKNRQSIRGELTQFVDEMAVPEEMILTITEASTGSLQQDNGAFLEQLQNLDHKINFLKEQSFRDAKSATDVKEIVDKLKQKSVFKIREFLLDKINTFKKPMTNYHIPQNTLLKFRFYFKFLMAHNREVAKEIKDFYIDTMSKVLFSYFKSYSGRLSKLQFDQVPGESDLMGATTEESGQSKSNFLAGNLNFFSSSMRSGAAKSSSSSGGGAVSGQQNRASVFTMGQRHLVLSEGDDPTGSTGMLLVPHALEKSNIRCPYEKLFRSEQFALMENACREYLFLCEFFMVQGNSALDLFTQVFGKTLHLLTKNVSDYVKDSFDSIALFLCLHLAYKFRISCREKLVPALETYWDAMNGQLWPRLQHVIKMNVQSIKECDPHKMKILDLRPHYVTRRYAEFSASFIGVNEGVVTASGGPEAKLINLLSEMQLEIENFILKMASAFQQSRKEQLIFVINNYDVVLSILSERTSGESKEAESFRAQFTNRSNEYVEEVLMPHFGDLIVFLKEAESLVERKEAERLKTREREIGQIVSGFNGKWQPALNSINKEVLGSFPNFKNGTAILQQALTQFVQYYHRFHKVMSVNELASCPHRNQLINVHQIMVEVKKYKSNF